VTVADLEDQHDFRTWVGSVLHEWIVDSSDRFFSQWCFASFSPLHPSQFTTP
jgi:hypothetical protein